MSSSRYMQEAVVSVLVHTVLRWPAYPHSRSIPGVRHTSGPARSGMHSGLANEEVLGTCRAQAAQLRTGMQCKFLATVKWK